MNKLKTVLLTIFSKLMACLNRAETTLRAKEKAEFQNRIKERAHLCRQVARPSLCLYFQRLKRERPRTYEKDVFPSLQNLAAWTQWKWESGEPYRQEFKGIRLDTEELSHLAECEVCQCWLISYRKLAA